MSSNKDNPYFAKIEKDFMAAYAKRAELISDMSSTNFEECKKNEERIANLAAQLIKGGVEVDAGDKNVDVLIEDEIYSVSKIELKKALGEDFWIIFPETSLEIDDPISQLNSYEMPKMENEEKSFESLEGLGNAIVPILNALTTDETVKNGIVTLVSRFFPSERVTTSISEDLSSIQRRIEVLDTEKRNATSRLEAMKNETSCLKAEVETKNNELNEKELEIEEKNKKINSLSQSVEEFKTEIESKNRKITSQESELKDKETSINSIKSTMNELRSEVERAKSEKERLLKERDSLTEERDLFNKEKNEATQSKMKITFERDLLVQERDQLKADKESLSQKYNHLSDEIEIIKKAKAESEKLSETLKSEKASIENKIKAFEESEKKYKEQEEKLKELSNKAPDTSKIDELNKTISTLRGDKDSLKAKNAELQKKVDEANNRVQDAQKKISDLNNKSANSDKIKNELDNAKAEMEKILKETEDMKTETEMLRQLAYVDQLTQVMNVNAFNKDFRDINLHEIAVIATDITGMKKLNETKGRKTGDKAIKFLASCLSKAFGNDHVYRTLGDKFVVLTNKTNINDVENELRQIKVEFTSEDVGMEYGLILGANYESQKEALGDAEKHLQAAKQH